MNSRTVESNQNSDSFVKLAEKISALNILLNTESQKKFEQLSIKSLDVTSLFIDYFNEQQILSDAFVIALIDKLSIHLTPAETFAHESFKATDSFELQIQGTSVQFKVQKTDFDKYWLGRTADNKNEEPEYILKESIDRARAMKEAKYSRFFHRHACRINDSRFLFSTYTQGTCLSILIKTIYYYKDKEKLSWVKSIFEQLNLLHNEWRVHKDIYAGNIIIDTKTHEARLIDFDRAAKARTPTAFDEDITDVCIHLLPKLFFQIELQATTEFYAARPIHAGMRELYLRSNNNNDEHKQPILFTSKQAMQFCRWMLHEIDTINPESIKQKAEEMLATDANIQMKSLLL